MDLRLSGFLKKNPKGQNGYSVSFEAALMFSLLFYNEAIGMGPVNYPSIM